MRSRTLGALLFATAFAACDGPGTGQMSLMLTDAPNPMIETATAWVSTIYVIRGNDTTGARDTISTTQRTFDLLDLQDGVMAALGTITLPNGSYKHIRVIVDSARVTLKAPITFAGGSSSATMKVPSGMTSGVKVNLSAPVVVNGGHTFVVIDFDVSQNFVFTGPSNNPTGVLFKPVLHATVESIAASISGTVTPASSHTKLYAILGTDTVQTALADTVSGTYTLRFLPPGGYTVTAVGAGVNASKTLTLRASQDTTGVNFP